MIRSRSKKSNETLLKVLVKPASAIYTCKKVQVGKDQEKAQSERDSHSKNRDGKKCRSKCKCKPYIHVSLLSVLDISRQVLLLYRIIGFLSFLTQHRLSGLNLVCQRFLDFISVRIDGCLVGIPPSSTHGEPTLLVSLPLVASRLQRNLHLNLAFCQLSVC